MIDSQHRTYILCIKNLIIRMNLLSKKKFKNQLKITEQKNLVKAGF
jgi:hypothetical protein